MSTMGDPRQMVLTTQYPPAGLLAPAAPGAPDASGGGGIGAGDMWRILKQRKLLITSTFIVIYMLVAVMTMLVYRYAPRYYSEAYIKLIPPAKATYSLDETILPRDYILHQLATESARIKDLALLQDVLSLPEIKETEYYRSFGDEFDKCLYDLRSRVSANPVRDTYLIQVGFSTKNKSEATLMVNKIVERFLRRSRSMESDEGVSRLETMKATKAAVEKELDDIRQRIANKRAQRDMPALEADREVQVDVISMLNNTVAELKTRAADIEAQLSTVRGIDPRNLPISAEIRVMIEADPVLRYYRQQVETLEIQMRVAQENMMGDAHRGMQLLRAQRDNYFEKEAARREELIDDYRSRQTESLQQEAARVRNMQVEIREQLAERENIQRDLDQAIQELEGWTKDEERLDRELEQIGLGLREAENQLVVKRREGTLSLAIEARDAIQPSQPNFKIWLGGGFVLALITAAGLAFLRELTDQAIRTPIDVARHGHLSVLGCVPLLDDEEADIESLELATRQAPQSLVAEAFRQVRAHLTFSGPLESQRTLLITSPAPEDGKTAVAINLAVTFAQAGERTLLIDCNFRRPAIRQAFTNIRKEGLSNILAGHAKLADVLCGTELSKLDVIASGPLPPNPAELLGSHLMRDLLDDVKQRYDRVILDGPPCLLISDALVVATETDAVVMVARAVNGTKGTLRRAREQLQRINARVIGAVLNGVQARPGGYFRQQYREFYDYTDEEVVMRELPEGPGGSTKRDADRPDES